MSQPLDPTTERLIRAVMTTLKPEHPNHLALRARIRELQMGVVPIGGRDIEKLASAIRTINKLHDLGDAVYDVRGRVGEDFPEYTGNSWDHPTVKEYNDAVQTLRAELPEAFK